MLRRKPIKTNCSGLKNYSSSENWTPLELPRSVAHFKNLE
jgi:hypothetical protein